MTLRKFDGNPLEWNNWFELFQTAIGNNPRLISVEKITYLQSLCTDNAKSLIESYGTNSSQYEQAILKLVRRYGNPKYVVSAFIRELEKFDQLILSEPQGFIRYSAFLRKLIHNFELSGYTADLNSDPTCSLKTPSKSTNEVGRAPRVARPRLRYNQRLDAVPH